MWASAQRPQVASRRRSAQPTRRPSIWEGAPASLVEESVLSLAARAILVKAGPPFGRATRFDARGGFRVEIPVAMPRDMPTTTREYAQLEESFAHERKCVPAPLFRPFPAPKRRRESTHSPSRPSAQDQHRRGAHHGARGRAREGSVGRSHRARDRGGGEAVGIPSPRRPRGRFRLACVGDEASP